MTEWGRLIPVFGVPDQLPVCLLGSPGGVATIGGNPTASMWGGSCPQCNWDSCLRGIQVRSGEGIGPGPAWTMLVNLAILGLPEEGVPVADEYLTLREVAELLKLSEKTVYRLAQRKEIPAFKAGGSWRFVRGDIDTWQSTAAIWPRPTQICS